MEHLLIGTPPLRPDSAPASASLATGVSSSSSSPLSPLSPKSSLAIASLKLSSSLHQKPIEPLARLDELTKGSSNVVKKREGQVLARGFILKTDHHPSLTKSASVLSSHSPILQGAPNFRAPKSFSALSERLGVFGCSQPTLTGLKTLLSVLSCSPQSKLSGRKAVWVSTREEPVVYLEGRPFVLRDSARPTKTMQMSDRAENLEGIERRLKADILRESVRWGGVILVHTEGDDGEILPTWIQVDESNVKTVREVWEGCQEEGWALEYHRIPVSPERPIEDNYLDAYLDVIRSEDPLTTSLIFNCGMGVVRTTFAMASAVLIRRKQFMNLGLGDPLSTMNGGIDLATVMSPVGSGSGFSTPVPGSQAAQILENAAFQQSMNRSLLRLVKVLDDCLGDSRSHAGAAEILTENPNLMESLRSAHMGNYQTILAMLGCLDNGKRTKGVVDTVVDICDAVINLRETIIELRVKSSIVWAMEDGARQNWLDKALKALEKYAFLIAFQAFIDEELSGEAEYGSKTFAQWLKGRPEVWNQISMLRKGNAGGSRLFVFAPASDLSLIARGIHVSADNASSSQLQRLREAESDGGMVLGDEWAEFVVNNRSGIILRSSHLLKNDQWHNQSASSADGVEGAPGFRQCPDSNVFAVGQPTEDSLPLVLEAIKKSCPTSKGVIWINLREEPLVFVNGFPYCLRKESLSLRNIKDYSGVSASRLEVVEARLKDDVLAELKKFDGRLLLHTETADGKVIPKWEGADEDSVQTVREVMESQIGQKTGIQLIFKRLPITSERPPDFSDIRDIMDLVLKNDGTPIVLNDQLGRGRSTVATVIVLLTQQWQEKHRNAPNPLYRSVSGLPVDAPPRPKRMSWQVINNLLRVIKNGLEVKQSVDDAIDRAGQEFKLRDAIEEARARAVDAKDHTTKANYIQEGIHHLRRYFELVLFAAYLGETRPEGTLSDLPTFESYVQKRPVFKTFEKDLRDGGLAGLTPLQSFAVSDGLALSEEVEATVSSRSGQILSQNTILKSDFFQNLQKLSLPERVEGAANYRKVPLTLSFSTSGGSVASSPHPQAIEGSAGFENLKYVYGTGMPSVNGLRNALHKMGASPDGDRFIYWTSLREEPVIYVNGRPHVLRDWDNPLVNVEATGVATEIVEAMEKTLKQDVIQELRKNKEGKILLHDEVEDGKGSFEIIPIWESVEEEDIQTPAEIYELMKAERFKVSYARVAVTDERAPLPAALDAMVKRVLKGIEHNADFAYNCQMGRGRTTTGMIASSLIFSVVNSSEGKEESFASQLPSEDEEDSNPYLLGEYKTILLLVSILSYGKAAKALADKTINIMDGVQNLRKAVFDYKIKADAMEQGTKKWEKMYELGLNYLYRYGTLIVLANYLIESKAQGVDLKTASLQSWLDVHREVGAVLNNRKSLD